MRLATLALLISLTASAAISQTMCGFYSAMIAQLGQKYGETRRSFGMYGPMQKLEIWASDETGTWTMLSISPGGMACVLASGDRWSSESLEKGDPA